MTPPAAAFDLGLAFQGMTGQIQQDGSLLLGVVGLMVALRIGVRLAKRAAGA